MLSRIGEKTLLSAAAGLFCIAGILYAFPYLHAVFEGASATGGTGGTEQAALAVAAAGAVLVCLAFVRRIRTGTLADPAAQLRLFAEGLEDSALFQLGSDGRITAWDHAAERLFGHPTRDAEGVHFSLLFAPEDNLHGKPEHWLKGAQENGRFVQQGRLARQDGSLFPARTVVTAITGPAGGLSGFSVVTRDITELTRAEDLARKLSHSVELTQDLIVITDGDGKVEFVNRAVETVTGFTLAEFGAAGLDLLRIREQDPRAHRMMREVALTGRAYQSEIAAVKKNGEQLCLDGTLTPICADDGRVSHVVFTACDLTPVRHMRSKIDFLASYDPLTGLPNRDSFAERLGSDLTAGGRTVALLALDIDRFKYINEIYGIEAGNSVLKQVAEGLSVSVGRGDTVGRLGSDEYGIILRDVTRPADVVLFVKMIMKNIPRIIMAGGEEIAVTLAVGIALFPDDGRAASVLMQNADMALAGAKGLGRNRFQFYTAKMNEGVSELVFMERRLSTALANREYMLTFQPYCDLASRKVAGAEALLTWHNDDFGLVRPSKFIPLLEETGMIIDVGTWVLRTACRQIREWTNGTASPPISVNLSPSQFRHEYLIESVRDAVRESGIDPGLLTLEITESTFMKDQDFAVTVLKRLKDIGVCLSIDDFGTGYSSLSYLKRFPVDYVKIDQSFIADVTVDPDATSLVSAIIAMAHGLGLKTIAEGVESDEQWKLLRLLKCDMAQGFHFSPAVTAEEFAHYLP